MTSEIIIPIPQELDKKTLADYFQKLISDDGNLEGELLQAMDLDLEDDRATVDDVKIQEIEVFSDEIVVHYVVSFSAYYGCADQNYADEDFRTISGDRRGTDWIFTRYVSPPQRYPNEEL